MTVHLEEALSILLGQAEVVPKERLKLEDCHGRVLAEDITSDIDFPPFNRSPLDGFAVRSEDIRGACPEKPSYIMQVDYVPAGSTPNKIIRSGQAARIMTGAPIPEGADAVVRLEDTCSLDGRIGILHTDRAAFNICSRGEEITKGEIVLRRGEVLNDGALALLALLGRYKPLIYRKPEVAILATGSELVSVDETLRPGKIRDSNSYMMFSKVLRAGGQPILLGHVQDDVSLFIEKLETAPDVPLYITTGGASVGDYDLMEDLFKCLNIPILFKRVAIKPGMPVIAGKWNNSLIIALSGNPAAGSVSFETLVRPTLRKIAGFYNYTHTTVQVTLDGEYKKASIARRFIWARCYSYQGIIYAKPLRHQGNGMLKSMVEANALLDIPAGTPELSLGEKVEAILLL